MKNHTRTALALATAITTLAFSNAAHSVTYTLSGSFGTTTYTGPLNGGSFSGTYDFTRPTIGSFDILLKDASNTLRAELTNANSHASFLQNFGGGGYDAIQFVSNGPDATATILSLDFALGFTGVGTVVPFPTAFPFSSFATLGGQTSATTSTVISGISTVPEPAAWLLFGVGWAALVGRRLRQGSRAASA